MGLDAGEITVIIAAAVGPFVTIVGYLFTNRQKNKEQSQGSVEWVVKQTTELYEDCKKRTEKMSSENQKLRQQKADLRRVVEQLREKIDDDKRG